MKLLVSPRNVQEARDAVEGGADIIDIKNPKEGSLGANFPWVIKDILDVIPQDVESSATLGDLAFKPGTASLAALGLSTLGLDYMKGGLHGIKTKKQAEEMGDALAKAVEGTDCKLIIAGYADFQEIGSISPLELPEIAARSGAAGVMIDTAQKSGWGLFDFMDVDAIQQFIDSAHDLGLMAALAGSLKKDDVRMLKEMGADIAGVRGAVCTDGDRVEGRVSKVKVRELKQAID
jgi:uncharacterized protein (UPF0264 family)